jgi:hypothetical protein
VAHNDTLLLSVTPSPLVASAATIGGVTIHENPEPSMGAGKVSSLSLASAMSASIARTTTASSSAGCSAAAPAARSSRRGIVSAISELH